jgi:hypothetical protein
MSSIILVIISIVIILFIIFISVYNTYFHKEDINDLTDYGIKYNLYKGKNRLKTKLKITRTLNTYEITNLSNSEETYHLEKNGNGISLPFNDTYKITSADMAHNPQTIKQYRIVWEENDKDGLYSIQKFLLSVVPLAIFAVLIFGMYSHYTATVNNLKAIATENFNSIQKVEYDLSNSSDTFKNVADVNLLFLTADDGSVEDALMLYNMNDSLTITTLYLNTPISKDQTLQDLVDSSKQSLIDFIKDDYCLTISSVTEIPKSVIYNCMDTMNGLVYDLHIKYIYEYATYCKDNMPEGYTDSIVSQYYSLLNVNGSVDDLSFEQFVLDSETAKNYSEWNRITSGDISHDNWDLIICYMLECLKNGYKNQGYALIFSDNSESYSNIKTTLPIEDLITRYTEMSYSIIQLQDDIPHVDRSFTIRNLDYNLTVSKNVNPYTEDYMSGFGYFPIDKARTCLYYCLNVNNTEV